MTDTTPTPNAAVPTPADPPAPGLAPSNSTNLTVLGGAIASIVMAILGSRGITFQAGLESALATLFAAVLGYLPKSGRK